MFRGPLTVLVLRLGVVGLVYSALRVLFWLHNRDLFPDPPSAVFRGGLRFDASAIAWTHLPWVLLVLISPRPGPGFGRVQYIVFLLINGIALFFNCVDLGYYAFSLKRSTADLLQIITAGGDTANLLPVFLRDYWHIALIYAACLGLLAWDYPRIGRLHAVERLSLSWRIIWRLVAVALFVLASRGGTQLIPLQPLDAARYGGGSYMPVVLNTPFTILTTLGKPTLEERNYMPQKEADALWPVVHHFRPMAPAPPDTLAKDSIVAPTALWARPERPNVVVIVLESFSALYSGRLAGGEGYMPFLDSLMGQGVYYTNAYANGRRSIDGIPAILAGMPQWMDEAFITSPYASLPFSSLASILGAEGYRTSFYHGGRNGTMGFDGFARSAGFERYVGMNEYANGDADFDGHWGVRDRPFLQFFAHDLAREQQPFLSTVFTLSSHHPYQLPPEEAKRFAGGTQAIHPTLRYTDDALRQFFATARTQPWYANTLFVITADHTADLERSGTLGNKPIDYWVPLAFVAPSFLTPKRDDRLIQHIDILPTVLRLVGHSKPFFAFGHDATEGSIPAYAIWSNNGLYSITSTHQQLRFNGEQVLDITPLGENASVDQEEAADMERRLKAAVQQYNDHLLRGALTFTPSRP